MRLERERRDHTEVAAAPAQRRTGRCSDSFAVTIEPSASTTSASTRLSSRPTGAPSSRSPPSVGPPTPTPAVSRSERQPVLLQLRRDVAPDGAAADPHPVRRLITSSTVSSSVVEDHSRRSCSCRMCRGRRRATELSSPSAAAWRTARRHPRQALAVRRASASRSRSGWWRRPRGPHRQFEQGAVEVLDHDGVRS